MDYAAIRVWHVLRGKEADSWRALQKRAAKEGAPIDALYLNAQDQWGHGAQAEAASPVSWGTGARQRTLSQGIREKTRVEEGRPPVTALAVCGKSPLCAKVSPDWGGCLL